MTTHNTADLLIEFGRKHGANSMIQGGKRIIDDLDEAVEYVISDDTGMNSYEHGSANSDFPIALQFNAHTPQDIAQALKTLLDDHGLQTETEPVALGNNKFRVMPNVFVSASVAGGTSVEVPNTPLPAEDHTL